MPKRKSLIVTTHYRPLTGGAQAVYDALCSAAPEHFAVLTASHDYTTGREVEAWRSFDGKAPYEIVRVPAMRPGLLGPKPGIGARVMSHLGASLLKHRVLRAVLDTARETGASVICIGALDALGWLVEPVRRKTGLPVVIYTHGEEISQQAHNARAEARRRKTLQAADGVIAVSSFTAQLIEQKYGLAQKAIKWLGNGVDLAKFNSRPTENVRMQFGLGAGPLVLSVGRLVARKGFDRLLEAWPRILASVPEAQLAIVGKGPLEADLVERAGGSEMKGSVHMLGHVSDGALPSLYASADLFVMPNRTLPDGDTEGFGLVFLEAAAAGTPSVGGRAGGAVDAIVDGTTGLLVDGEDTGAIAFAVTDLLKDEVKRLKMGDAARAHALTQGWDNKAAELLSWLDRIETRDSSGDGEEVDRG
jgi:phosphatidylinositol alpha-1,6-mannosyltransferase